MKTVPFFPLLPARRRDDGNAFIVVVIFIAIFSIVVGACYVLSDETNRRTSRENHYVSGEVAADAAHRRGVRPLSVSGSSGTPA